MSTDPNSPPRPLPAHPNLRHLKDQAKDLFKSGEAASISGAQFKIARLYGFPSWPKLKARVDALEDFYAALDTNDVERIRTLLGNYANELVTSGAAVSHADAHAQIARLWGLADWDELETRLGALKARGNFAMHSQELLQLKRAIGADDLHRISALMTRHPALHSAPFGYGRNGPLTCVAECPTPPSAARLAIAKWMIQNGSDVHQGGDGPLMRAALIGGRIPMMELLVSLGADVNATWGGHFPIIFAACEGVEPESLKWLLDHGASPNASNREHASALDYVIGTYVRSPELGACIDMLVTAGGRTKYDPSVLDLLRGRLDHLAAQVDADPALVSSRFSELDFGATGGRLLTLKGGTLLHVAAEYRNLEAIDLLLSRGADIDARAAIDKDGCGGQTAIFHAVTQLDDSGVPTAQLLIERGADLSIRVKLPGHYERPREVVECTPLGYALKFQDVPTRSDKAKTVALLRERGAVE